MTGFGLGLVVAVVVLVLAIVLEGKRQARIYGPPSARPNLLGVGLLEVQRHLQADRKVGVIQREQRGQVEERQETETGDGIPPGERR